MRPSRTRPSLRLLHRAVGGHLLEVLRIRILVWPITERDCLLEGLAANPLLARSMTCLRSERRLNPVEHREGHLQSCLNPSLELIPEVLRLWVILEGLSDFVDARKEHLFWLRVPNVLDPERGAGGTILGRLATRMGSDVVQGILDDLLLLDIRFLLPLRALGRGTRCRGFRAQDLEVLAQFCEEPLDGLLHRAVRGTEGDRKGLVPHEQHFVPNVDGHENVELLRQASCSSFTNLGSLDGLADLLEEGNSRGIVNPPSGRKLKALFKPFGLHGGPDGKSLEVHKAIKV